jgi:hypothetical protein
MKHLLDNTRRHDITFNADGRIEISARATRALDLHPGDVIDVAIDEVGRECYLYIKHRAEKLSGRHKAQCHVTNSRVKKCNSLRAHSVELCRKVLDMRGISSNQARLPVGDVVAIDGINSALPIIIRYNANS